MSQFFTNDFSQEIWETTYKAPEDKTIEDTWERVAKSASLVEKESIQEKVYQDFKFLLEDFKFVPGGRILANLGVKTRSKTTLYNCFTWDPRNILFDCDSIEGIYEALKRQALTLKTEGGYGINASFIRPEGSFVKGIGVRTPGVLKFMELWDKSSEVITMGSTKVLGEKKIEEKNKIRKGAQMLILGCWHPEIEDFIIAKRISNRFTKFNISVGITEGFMDAVINNKNWDLKFPDTTYKNYKSDWNGFIEEWEEKGYPIITYKTIKANELWNKIIESTYKFNDPGVIFFDTVNKLNPISYCEKINTTNPCQEIGMSTGVCNLGSINLTKCIKLEDNKVFFDFDLFKKLIVFSIRFLDNINDISTTPLPEYDKAVKEKRRIGLGTFGLGSLHYILGIKFGSKKSLELINQIYKIKCEEELLSSSKLGLEKGDFSLFDKQKYFNTFYWKNLKDKIDENIIKNIESIGHMRNSHQSMNAPTGNTSIFANCISGGIEPVFLKEYLRWSIVPEVEKRELLKKGLDFIEPHKGEWRETKYFKFSTRGKDQILKGSFEGINYEIDKNRGLIKSTLIEDYGWRIAKEFYKDKIKEMDEKGIFNTTQDLTVQDHINTLKIISSYINQACSKTVNVPNNYDFNDFQKVYLEAWRSGIKGITTYREGTMSAVLEENKEKNERITPKRPQELNGEIFFFVLNKQSYYVAVGLNENGSPHETFTGINHNNDGEIYIPKTLKEGKIIKNGGGNYYFKTIDNEYRLTNNHNNDLADGLSRILSCSLRHNVNLLFLVQQLEKTKGELFSFSKILARTLKKYIPDGELKGQKCKKCGGILVMESNCCKCRDCGDSKCQ